MKQPPLITIITVTYNAESVIEKTLDSLRHQTFQDFEHLVIDGKSYDTTIKKIVETNLPQTFLISEPDRGLYDAMNKGLGLAKGKYLLFLNAGDSFHSEDTLMHYALAALRDKDIIYGDTIVVDKQGTKISDRHLSVPEKLTKKSFSDGMLICHQAFMVKKDLVERYDLAYRYSADYDWCIKSIKKSDADNNENLGMVTIDFLSDGLTDKHKYESLRERFQIMSRHYGLPVTIMKHIGFIFRALKRGRV